MVGKTKNGKHMLHAASYEIEEASEVSKQRVTLRLNV